MHFSRRAQRLAESATLRVSRKVAERKAAGDEVVDLGAGQPDFPSPAVAVEAARRALAEGFTRYTAGPGIPDLRHALAAYYRRRDGAPWRLANTVVTVGAKAALFELVHVLVDEGDDAVLPSPAWVSFEEQIRLAGGRPIAVPMSAADRFAVRAEPIIDALTDRTRMVLINSPCNPTGGMISAGELRRLVEVCAERGIVLLSDETYERFVYDGETMASVAALAAEFPETVVLVSSFSKTYAMTGWRVGYALGPKPLIGKAVAMQGHMTSNVTSFAMVGALAALEGAAADVEAMIVEYAHRRDLIVRGLERLAGVTCLSPPGAFYAFPHVAAWYGEGRRDSVELAEYLLDSAGVAVVPGAAFGADDHIRLSFACSRQDLATGLERMERALSR